MRAASGLIGQCERIDDLIQIAVEHLIKLIERQADAVIRHPSLREVIGTNALVAHPRADLTAPLGRAFGALPGALGGIQARGEDLHRAILILILAALILTLDDRACRQVRDADGALGLVDMLTARA